MSRILTLTLNPTIDLSARVPRVLPEHKLRCRDDRQEPGGGGLNVSRALHNLGEASTAHYVSGGHVGRRLEELLDEAGIDHRPLRVAGNTRQNLIVREEEGEAQYRFGFPGPNLTAEDVDRMLDTLRTQSGYSFLVASGSLPPGTPDGFLAEVARLVKAAGARLVVDSSGEPLRRVLEEGVYLVKPNRRELSAAVEREVQDETAEEEAVETLVAEGRAEVVLVSLGAAGGLLATSSGVERLRAPSVPRRSAIGAGDSMLAGIVRALVRGESVREAVKYGLAAGSAAVLTPGTGLCRGEDVANLYESLTGE